MLRDTLPIFIVFSRKERPVMSTNKHPCRTPLDIAKSSGMNPLCYTNTHGFELSNFISPKLYKLLK